MRLLLVVCLLLSGCDAVVHQALAPKRVHVDPVRVEPMFTFMHTLGVESYGTVHSCDYIVDERGAFVSDLKADGCDRFADEGVAPRVFDALAKDERAMLQADAQSLGLPALQGISLVYDDKRLLTRAGFGVDSCVEYTFEPAAPLDLDLSSRTSRGSSPWTTEDVCRS